MDYKRKYLKYKSKYLDLKNKKTYHELKAKFILRGGNPFRVIRNTGSNPDGTLTNQCMWFSIRDFLRLNGFPDITIEEVRDSAGIGHGYNNRMFDFYDEHLRASLQRLIDIYRLRIRVFPVEHTGHLSRYWYRDDIAPRPAEYLEPNGSLDDVRDVNLAQYGTGHFNLIVGGYGLPEIAGADGQDFIAAIPVNTGKGTILKEVSELTSTSQKITAEYYQRLFDMMDFKKFLMSDIKKDEYLLARNKDNYDKTKQSSDLAPRDRQIIADSIMKTDIAPVEEIILTKKRHISEIDSEIEAIKLQIKEYED